MPELIYRAYTPEWRVARVDLYAATCTPAGVQWRPMYMDDTQSSRRDGPVSLTLVGHETVYFHQHDDFSVVFRNFAHYRDLYDGVETLLDVRERMGQAKITELHRTVGATHA